ncbi:RNA-directed DNA polymerase [Micromonospora sp. NPDC094482]|uniref:RNA-directed DNA polymerase n=1 Tax=unclassified Micromonospora TaxID=2617518 RepID=UPI0033337AD4
MNPLDKSLVGKLKLEQAVLEEVETRRNLLPPEPWVDAVRSNSASIAAWVKTRLLAGDPNSPGIVVNARKLGHGIRPVPILGVAERVSYRALAKLATDGIELPNRTPETYREFIHAPISYAYEHIKQKMVHLGDARIKYVLEADITAFYQYVDHEVLRQELQMQTGEVEGASKLIELLGEINGKAFGIPQLLDASDWLSEAYIRIVERNLIRNGLAVWRFNDDFRIGCGDYRHALKSLEELAQAARDVGLVVGDHKTFTTTFFNYMFAHTDMDVDKAAAAFDPQDVEVAVSDYSDQDEAGNVVWAVQRLRRIDSDPKVSGHINLRSLRAQDMRDLRRAISVLTRNSDPQGAPWLTSIFRFVPALTPSVVGYMVEVHGTDADAFSQQWRELAKYTVSDWQAMWLCYAARKMGLVASNADVQEWMRTHIQGHASEPLKAEAYLALADGHLTNFDELDAQLRSVPDALAPWYLLAIKSLSSAPTPPSDKQLGAIRQSSPLFRALLK